MKQEIRCLPPGNGQWTRYATRISKFTLLRNDSGVCLDNPWFLPNDSAQSAVSMKKYEITTRTSELLKIKYIGKEWYLLVQPSFLNWGKTKKDTASFLEIPGDYAEGICTKLTHTRIMQNTGLTDFEDHLQLKKFGYRRWVVVKIAINSLLRKQNNTRRI